MLEWLHHRLIVSCQSSAGEAFHSPDSMARFALAARDGGAAGIRQAVDLPIRSIKIRSEDDGNGLIAPDFEYARALVQAGASAIAPDCTARARSYGALARLRVPVLADIATEEEAIAAAGAGDDFALTTMRGYSAGTVKIRVFEPAFITRLSARLSVPVIAEGMIATPAPARTAITRPHELTRSFEQAIQTDTAHCIGIATGDGRAALLAQIAGIVDEGVSEGPVPRAIGDATAGWVDTNSGEVVFANESMPGWTGTVLNELGGLRVFADNDARATLLGELRDGAARGCQKVILITGVGGAILVNGPVVRGASSLAGALGQPPVANGTLDVYAKQADLLAQRFALDTRIGPSVIGAVTLASENIS